MAPTNPSLHGLPRFFGGLARALVAAVALLGAWLTPAGCDSNPTPHPERPDSYKGDDKPGPSAEPNEGFFDDGRDNGDGDPAQAETDVTSSDALAGDTTDGASSPGDDDDASGEETTDQGEAGFADPAAPCDGERGDDFELGRDDTLED